MTLAEVLEGAADPAVTRTHLARYRWQGIHRAHAERVALRQRRSSTRMGENDAWQAAVADSIQAAVLGHDSAFSRLGARYRDHRA